MKISKITLLLFLTMLSINSYAQSESKLYIETNLARYADDSGFFGARQEFSGYNFSLLNGIKLGYRHSPTRAYFIEYRQYRSRVESSIHKLGGAIDAKGTEFVLGVDPFSAGVKNRRISIKRYIGLFGDFSTQKGDYWDKENKFHKVDLTRSFFGLAFGLEVQARLSNKISIVASSRYRFGWMSLSNTQLTIQEEKLYPNKFESLLDPVHGLSLRFDF